MYIVAVASGKNSSPFFGYCSGYSKGGFSWPYGASYNKNFTYIDIFHGHRKHSVLKPLYRKGDKSCVTNSVECCLSKHCILERTKYLT
jgi:hypothetical protein